jgi:hypothetical protein
LPVIAGIQRSAHYPALFGLLSLNQIQRACCHPSKTFSNLQAVPGYQVRDVQAGEVQEKTIP